jgi:hypothetical protein
MGTTSEVGEQQTLRQVPRIPVALGSLLQFAVLVIRLNR